MGGGVYIHEILPIEGGGRGDMIEMLRTRWAPHVESEYGVRLFGVWATVGSTGAWPELRVQWELDDWEHFARAHAGQLPVEEKDVFLHELWSQALDYRKGGRSALLRPVSFSPDREAIASEGLASELLLLEDVRALPGRLDAYHAALQSAYLPLAEARGLRLLGAYRHALLPNTGMNLWALQGWAHWRSWMEAEPGDAELRAWSDGLGAWLEDIDGFLVASPPGGALRT